MSLKFLVTLLYLFAAPVLHASSGVKGNRADYVIVGVGTAGGVLAKKLTDDKKTSVIALHSGENFTGTFILKYGKNTTFSVASSLLGSPIPDLPPEVQEELQNILDLSAISARPLYEAGSTTPQFFADDEELLWVIPLPLGGGSSVNAGAWCRGTDQFYSQWEAVGGPAWSAAQVMQTYKELENYRGKTTNSAARGHHGPLTVVQNPVSRLSQVFTQAVIDATGTPFVLDYNDPNTPLGVSSQLQLTRKGEQGYYRVSSATAFLGEDVVNSGGKGVGGRKLQIRLGSAALRVIWNGTTAVGVEYVQDGETKQAYAKKGVIVCAGLRSSAFLMQSGVGDPAVLTPLGIPVVYANPQVGQGLVDQPHIITLFSSNPSDSGYKGNSPFSQIAWLPDPTGALPGRQLRLATVDVIPGATLALLDLCQPMSRGTITINSANPLDPPVIDLGILSDSSDLDLYIAGFQIYISNINTALQAIDPAYALLVPPPEILSDTLLLTEFIQASVESNMHFQGHCSMGTVVDSSGRVIGVSNLFVADNSIIPTGSMDGSPMASGQMIGANIARLLGH